MTQYLTTLPNNVLVYTSSWIMVPAVCAYKRFLVIILYFTSGLLDSLLCQEANFGCVECIRALGTDILSGY
jgi:hypothetical protein